LRGTCTKRKNAEIGLEHQLSLTSGPRGRGCSLLQQALLHAPIFLHKESLPLPTPLILVFSIQDENWKYKKIKHPDESREKGKYQVK
jgi:hypothetical protein